MAQANVEVKVQSQDLERLKGQLVELQKGLKIQYDIDGKPIDVVLDKSLNLQKQVRLLTAELRKTKEGTAEFTLLSQKLNDAKDNLDRVNVKSRDLFASLSLLPGPVGVFFGQLNGAIGLMKTFSGFSLKDIRNQFKETVNDIKDIIKNLFGLNKSTEDLDQTTKDLTQAQQQQTAATVGAVAAIKDQTKSTSNLSVEINKNGQAVINATKPIKDMTKEELKLFNEQKKKIQQNKQIGAGLIEQARATQTANNAIQNQTKSQEKFNLVTNLGSKAANGLKLALSALGIGALIFLVSNVVMKLIDFVNRTKESEEANKALEAAIDSLNESLDTEASLLQRQTEYRAKLAKLAGKDEKEIYKIRRDGLLGEIKNLDLVLQKNGQLDQLRDELNRKAVKAIISEEEYRKESDRLQEERIKLEEKREIKRLELNSLTIDVMQSAKDKAADKDKKRIDDGNKYAEEQRQRDLQADQEIQKLKEQNYLASVADERKRQEDQLVIEFENERKRIKGLQINDERKNQLLLQTETQYENKYKELKSKFAKEDEDNRKKINEKMTQLRLDAIEDETQKSIVKIQEGYEEELKVLNKALEDKLITQEQYNQAVLDLNKKSENEIAKVTDDFNKDQRDKRIKRLDDELRLLELQQSAIREGTKAYYDNQRAILDAAEKKEIEASENKEKEILAIKEKYAKLRRDIDKQEKNATLQLIGETVGAAGQLFGALASLYEDEAKTSKKAFENRKKLQVASAVMGAAQSIISVLSAQPAGNVVLDGILKGIRIAVVAAQTAAQISQIQKTQFEGSGGGSGAGTVRGMARGGYIDGPRHAQGGTLIEAEGGEAVMTRGAVSMFRPILSMMNEAGGGTSFNKNLMVTANDAPLTTKPAEQMAPTIVKTYVVSNELTSEQEKLARLKNLSTL